MQLGSVALPVDRSERPVPGMAYRQIGVRLWGEGAYERATIDGGETKYAQLFKTQVDDIIVNKIWARNGSVAVVNAALDGCYGSGEFPMFAVIKERLAPAWVHWLTKTPWFWSQCDEKSRGTSGKNRIRPEQFLEIEIPLPPLLEQQALVGRLDSLANNLGKVTAHLDEIDLDTKRLLAGRFRHAIDGAAYRPMAAVAPTIRRSVTIDNTMRYREVGARSFGKGLFLKPDFVGAEATWEKPVWVEQGDLVLSNIKAWEGAIAVAGPKHDRCIASHRYITCVPRYDVATSGFLGYYFLTQDGLDKIGVASPGTADRNRTLSLSNLGKIDVPVPMLSKQQAFDALQAKVADIAAQRAAVRQVTAALIPAMLGRVFGS